ncbi:DUF4214 domain-containing protein [Butyrivibrio proteoclasticus]|uniref:DUF4214 domain-containing protein n=1 Tax=Butyrivibrio proteoclasticus TaxID=43305 RepID=UPI00094215A0|nr:DUF4214 domain-containing protein [Butyrivibrio proteoclasticus]
MKHSKKVRIYGKKCEETYNRDYAPDEVGRANWLNKLANGASREDVMNGFGGSQEFANMLAGFGL